MIPSLSVHRSGNSNNYEYAFSLTLTRNKIASKSGSKSSSVEKQTLSTKDDVIWSPFSNFHLHLKLPVTASKLQLSFVLPYFSSHCVQIKYGADQIWRAFYNNTNNILPGPTMLPGLATMLRRHESKLNFKQHFGQHCCPVWPQLNANEIPNDMNTA